MSEETPIGVSGDDQGKLIDVPATVDVRRPDQILFDVMDEEFGPVRTKDERGRRNAAIRQLLEAGATEEEVRICIAFCRRNFTHFTEKALCGWLSQSLREHSATSSTRETFLRMIEGGKRGPAGS